MRELGRELGRLRSNSRPCLLMLAICAMACASEPAILNDAPVRQPSSMHDMTFTNVHSKLARDGYFVAKSVFAREKVARWRSLTEEHFAFIPGSASEFLAEQNPETSWLTELLYENRFSALLQSAGPQAVATSPPRSTCFSTTISRHLRRYASSRTYATNGGSTRHLLVLVPHGGERGRYSCTGTTYPAE